MSYYLLPVRPRIFEPFQRAQRQQFGGQTATQSPASKAGRIALIVFGSIFGLFAFLLVVGLFTHDQAEQPASEETETYADAPVTADDMVQSGNDFFNDSQYDSAEKYYDKALFIDDSHTGALYGKGIALYYQERQSEATSYFQRAYDGGYKNAWLSWVLGDIADKNGDIGRAMVYYKECLGLDSSFTSVYDRLAVLDPGQADAYRKMSVNKGN